MLGTPFYLTGFMGCGKTRLGQALAQRLGWRWIDTDHEIERQTGKTIARIFKDHGESHFRKLESQVLNTLKDQKRVVISLGGGAILTKSNRQILKKGHWIFLHRPEAVIEKHLLRSDRPLLQNGQSWREIYQRRLPIYEQAPITLYGEDFEADALAKRLIDSLKGEF